MMPTVFFQSAEPGTCTGISLFTPGASGSTGTVMGPIFFQVAPLSELRSI